MLDPPQGTDSAPGYLVSQAAAVGTSIPYLTWVYALLQERNGAFKAQRNVSHEPSWGSHAYVKDLLGNGPDLGMVAVAT